MSFSLLKPASEFRATHLKMALYGFQGSGKTHKATNFASGLYHYLAARGLKPGPVAFFDTEGGLPFMRVELETAKVPCFGVAARSLEKVIAVTRECVSNGVSTLIIDSISAIWEDVQASYQTKYGRTRLQFEDWANIKRAWAEFRDLFLTSPLHIIVCGRAGWEYADEERTAANGKVYKTSVRTDTKMRAEGQFLHEPSIVFELEQEGKAPNAKFLATCLKDRNTGADGLTGKVIEDLWFDRPNGGIVSHLARFHIGEAPTPVDTKDSQDLFEDPKSYTRDTERKILIEDFQGELKLAFPGATAENTHARQEIAKKLLGTVSETALYGMALGDLRGARAKLDDEIKNRKQTPKGGKL